MRQLTRIVVCGVALLAVPPPLAAVAASPASASSETERQLPELNADATLNDYLAFAALSNRGLEAAYNRWQAALQRVPQARSLPDPRLSYTYFIEEVETRVGPQEQKLGIMQMFPWPGTLRLRGDAALENAAATRASYEQAKLELFHRVAVAYCEYWYLGQAVALTRQHLKLVANLEGVARTRFKAGVAPNSAVTSAQVELGKLDDRLRTQEALRRPLTARLNAALNRSAAMPLPWPPTELPAAAAPFTDEDAGQWLIEDNPRLMRLDHLAAGEEAAIALARKSGKPDITLGLDYVATGDALNPTALDSGKDPLMAMVSINVPIWRGKYRAAEREARLKRAAVEETRSDTEATLAADLEYALFRYHDAERKIDLFEDTLVPKAEQSLKVAQQGFEAGATSFISLIDAQRLLLEFQLAHHRARADLEQSIAEIEMLTNRRLRVGSGP